MLTLSEFFNEVGRCNCHIDAIWRCDLCFFYLWYLRVALEPNSLAEQRTIPRIWASGIARVHFRVSHTLSTCILECTEQLALMRLRIKKSSRFLRKPELYGFLCYLPCSLKENRDVILTSPSSSHMSFRHFWMQRSYYPIFRFSSHHFWGTKLKVKNIWQKREDLSFSRAAKIRNTSEKHGIFPDLREFSLCRKDRTEHGTVQLSKISRGISFFFSQRKVRKRF